ncbi:MAG: FAD-dependent oxidoreductase [Undibacterium sp.]|nr:FAD-dependent oxidoreductase [Opitutaceae bacterium]
MNTQSYWLDAADIKHFPSLTKSVDVEVIVVGGGITGITAAYLAKRAGKKVALIERARCASIDTGHTTAHLTAVTDLRLHELVKIFGKDVARATWDAGVAGIDQIAANIRRENIACDFHWVPGYLHHPAGVDASTDEIGRLKEDAEIATELEIAAEFESRVPAFGMPGVKFRHQALFNPRKYLAALLEEIPGDGSYVFEDTWVDEFTDQPLVAKCGQHHVRGQYLVVATHDPITGIAPMSKALLLQTKLALYTSYVIGGKLPLGTLMPALFWNTADPYDYLRVERKEGHDYVIFGGEDHKTGQEQDTMMPYARLEERLKQLLPQIDIDHRWSGQVIETNDGLPFIGEIVERQFIATGFSGNGMTFGTLAAMMAVDALMGRENPWTEIFAVDRTKLLGGTWAYLKENMDYPFFMVRDRLAPAEGSSLRDLAKGEGKILGLDGKKVAAFRDEDGKVTLCSPVCTHLKGIVRWNTAEKTWDCPCHGARFKPTGEVMSGPAEDPLELIKQS